MISVETRILQHLPNGLIWLTRLYCPCRWAHVSRLVGQGYCLVQLEVETHKYLVVISVFFSFAYTYTKNDLKRKCVIFIEITY